MHIHIYIYIYIYIYTHTHTYIYIYIYIYIHRHHRARFGERHPIHIIMNLEDCRVNIQNKRVNPSHRHRPWLDDRRLIRGNPKKKKKLIWEGRLSDIEGLGLGLGLSLTLTPISG